MSIGGGATTTAAGWKPAPHDNTFAPHMTVNLRGGAVVWTGGKLALRPLSVYHGGGRTWGLKGAKRHLREKAGYVL